MNNNFASPVALAQPVSSHPRPTLQLRLQAHHHTLFQSVSTVFTTHRDRMPRGMHAFAGAWRQARANSLEPPPPPPSTGDAR